jgi:formyltetrahydrofolate synthetase
MLLARAVAKICDSQPAKSAFKYAYPDRSSIVTKMEAVAMNVYGASGVELSDLAKQQVAAFELEPETYAHLPLCVAKTQYSFSCDPNAKGVPTDFTVPVREFKAAVGAGFIVAYCGDIATMPGLTTRPGFVDMDLDPATGRVIGLF